MANARPHTQSHPMPTGLIDTTETWESWGIAARWNPQHGWHDPTLENDSVEPLTL
jgi:hypothetical protein